jgi:hypothetical protein
MSVGSVKNSRIESTFFTKIVLKTVSKGDFNRTDAQIKTETGKYKALWKKITN